MSLRERDIAYEAGRFWVFRHPKGHFEIYEIGVTCSARRAIIGYRGDEGLARAKAHCDALAEGAAR